MKSFDGMYEFWSLGDDHFSFSREDYIAWVLFLGNAFS